MGYEGEDLHGPEEVGPRQEQDREGGEQEGQRSWQEGLRQNQGLDRGSPKGEEGLGLEGLRVCQEGLRAVQGGQGHLQRVRGTPTLDTMATAATLRRARLAWLQQGSWLFMALFGIHLTFESMGYVIAYEIAPGKLSPREK